MIESSSHVERRSKAVVDVAVEPRIFWWECLFVYKLTQRFKVLQVQHIFARPALLHFRRIFVRFGPPFPRNPHRFSISTGPHRFFSPVLYPRSYGLPADESSEVWIFVNVSRRAIGCFWRRPSTVETRPNGTKELYIAQLYGGVDWKSDSHGWVTYIHVVKVLFNLCNSSSCMDGLMWTPCKQKLETPCAASIM